MKETINLIWTKDPNKLYERDWLIRLLSNFNIRHIVGRDGIYCDKAIVVSNNSGDAKESEETHEYIREFKRRGFRVGCIHLSDEQLCDPLYFYQPADFIFRNYYREGLHQFKNKCHFFALGYNSGFREGLLPKKITERKVRVSFCGFCGDSGNPRPTRNEMLRRASDIPGKKYFHITVGGWNDRNNLPVQKYAEIMCDTVFALCPRGFRSPDSFRLYEALEAGAIPVVEDAHFWKKCYGPDFPCIVIDDWSELEARISGVDIEAVSQKTRDFWRRYVLSLTKRMTGTVEQAFSINQSFWKRSCGYFKNKFF